MRLRRTWWPGVLMVGLIVGLALLSACWVPYPPTQVSPERLAPPGLRHLLGTDGFGVDMYSGFVYSMMGIPKDLFTPLFACARMAGWAAHRFEEIVSGKRIIRPAYKATYGARRAYVPLEKR